MKNFVRMKRALSILLCLCMVIGMFPGFTVTAHAHDVAEIVAPVMETGEESPVCDHGTHDETIQAISGKMSSSAYSSDTVYVHLTLKAVDVSGNEVTTGFDSYIDQDGIDNREGYGADFSVGDTYTLSGFGIDGYTVKDEEITFTVYSSGNISITSGNASVEYGSDTTYIVIPVYCIDGDRVTIDCSTINLKDYPYQAWGPGWSADGSVDLHILILTEPYIFILENSESMTKDNVECIRILNGAILEAGTLTEGVLVYAENGKIQSGAFISQVNVYADGEICGGTFNNVYNKGVISAGTFNGELTNYGTIINNGDIQLGEDFVLVQNGTVECNEHIWRDGICRLCSLTCQHNWANGTCTVCGEVCPHTGGTATCTEKAVCTVCGASYGELANHSTTAEGDSAANCNSKAYCSVCESYYGEVDKTNHDETVAYVNGFCPNGCYEPATYSDLLECYEISNAGQLYWFAAKVNAGSIRSKGRLTDDIIINEGVLEEMAKDSPDTSKFRVWTPINNFTGIFCGEGKTISGLYYNGSSDYVGLFGSIGIGGTVQEVGVVDSYLKGNQYVGGVAGYNYSTVTSCYNTGAVSGTGYYVGGVAGYNEGTLMSCCNSGSVTGESGCVGGMVGYNVDGSVESCYNTGIVTGDDSVGGVVGKNYHATVTSCYNTGAVSGTDYYVGGVAGNSNWSSVTNCYSTGNVEATESHNIGGVLGNKSGGTAENCYYLTGTAIGGINNTDVVGEVEPKTAEEFASGEVAYLLQGEQTDQVWGQNIDNGESAQNYPVFSDARVYRGYTSCAEESVIVYTNDSGISAEKPSHSTGAEGDSPATCMKQAFCSVCKSEYGEVDETNHVAYENGFCLECGAYQPAELVGTYYQIANAGQLYWFAAQVNSGNTAINGELKADIVVNENVLAADGTLNGDGSAFRVWTPIGTEANAYTGEFCGNEHTVSGLYFNSRSADYVGLFGYVGSGGTVQNVGVIDSYFKAGWYVGGVAGLNKGTLQYVYNTGNVNGSKYAGGVTGENNYIVEYAYNTGTVFAMDYAGGVTGYNNYIVQYAYNTGFAGGAAYYGGIAGDNRHTLKDCYYLADSETETDALDGTTAKTAGQFEIGEVAYLLGDVFGQNIDNGETVQTLPVLSDATVYAVQNCKNEVAYSNTNENIGHIGGTATCIEKAVCTVCGASYGAVGEHSTTAEGDIAADCNSKAYCSVCKSEYGEVDKTKHDANVAYENGFCPNGCYEPASDSDFDGYYEIDNAGKLYWFAAQVNSGNTAINGKLTQNIVVNEGTLTAETTDARAWTPIGQSTYLYNGTFNGGEFTVSGLYCGDSSADYASLFGAVDDEGIVENVGVLDSYLNGSAYAGGVVGQNWGTVASCYNTGTVCGSGCVGGVVGRNAGTVTNCRNTGNVTGNYSSIGGVVGCSDDGTVASCYNTGAVSGDYSVGGVVGSSSISYVKNCYNSGNVTGKDSVGGVVGFSNNCTVENCYNIGYVSGIANYIGGVIGINESTVTNCYYLSGCALDGKSTVQFGIGNPYLGGTTADEDGKTIGKFSAQFASGEVAYLLQGQQTAQVWGQVIGSEDHPVLGGEKVYCGCYSCAADAEKVYTNFSAAKPIHIPNDSGYTDITTDTHSFTCVACGESITEEHYYDDSTLLCACGAIHPDAVATVSMNGEVLAACYSLNAAVGKVNTATAEDEAVVTLLKDCEHVSIDGGVFTLNLGGNSLRTENIRSEALIVNGGTVTVTGGTISGTRYAVDVVGGTLNITGDNTVITTTENHNAAKTVDVSGGVLNISGGTVTGEVKGVHVQEGGTVNITGGTVRTEGNKASGSVYMKGGTAHISGGEFYDKYALNMEGGTAYVTGGLFRSDNRYALRVLGGTAYVTGGTFIGSEGSYADVYCTNGTVILGVNEETGVGAIFPDDLTVSGTTLNAILADGASYWQGDNLLTVADDAEDILDGDVTIKSSRGWVELSGAWYYIDPATGEKATGIAEIEDNYYVFDDVSGVFLADYTGIYEANNGDLYYVENGVAVKNKGLVRMYEDGEVRYYYFGCSQTASDSHADNSCDPYKAQKGCVHWVEINNDLLPKWDYTFGDDGVIVHDDALNNNEEQTYEVVNYDSVKYYTIDGIKVHYGLFVVDGYYYYARSDGSLIVGRDYWISESHLNGVERNGQPVEEGSYTFDSEGRILWADEKNGIYAEDGSLYYYVEGIRTYAGLIVIDGNYYYVRTNGEVVNGRNYWITKHNNLLPAGSYTFDEEGKLVGDVATLPDNEDADFTGIMDGYYYENGQLAAGAGLVEINGSYYYVRSSGAIATGRYWVTNHNGLVVEGMYTFDKTTGAMVDTPLVPPAAEETFTGVKDGYYYENGEIASGAGLIEVDGLYYYVRSNGQVATGEYYVTNTNDLGFEKGIYTFDSNGAMIG